MFLNSASSFNARQAECLYLKATPNPGLEEAEQCSEKYPGLESELSCVYEGEPYETAVFVSVRKTGFQHFHLVQPLIVSNQICDYLNFFEPQAFQL